MKNLDVFSKRLFIVALSISMVLLSASFFVFSINHASAQNNSYQAATGGVSGRYGMATVIASSRIAGGKGGGETINRYNILVWDTESGASKIYFYDDNSASYLPTLKQLPPQPLN